MDRRTLRVSHRVVLAFVGWYLMMPPMAAELHPECSPGAKVTTSELFLSFFAGTSPREFELKRCDRLRHSVEPYAPMASWPDIMSTWQKIDEYDTLQECDSQYQENQTVEVDTSSIRNIAVSELSHEANNPISPADLEARISEIKEAARDQIRGERCIASDPNLAKD